MNCKIIISFDVVNYSGTPAASNPAGISFCADIYNDTDAYVKNAAELNYALSDSSVNKINFLNDITDGDLTISRIVTINFNGFTYNGNMSFATNQSGIVSYTVTTTSEFNTALANTIVSQIILGEGIYSGNFVINWSMDHLHA